MKKDKQKKPTEIKEPAPLPPEAEAEMAAEEGDVANEQHRLEWFAGAFRHVGRNLKVMATVILLLGIVGSIAAGIFLLCRDQTNPSWIAFPIMLAGSLVSWLIGCIIYAIGALAEKYL